LFRCTPKQIQQAKNIALNYPFIMIELSSRYEGDLKRKQSLKTRRAMLKIQTEKSVKLYQNNTELTNLKHSSSPYFYRKFQESKFDGIFILLSTALI